MYIVLLVSIGLSNVLVHISQDKRVTSFSDKAVCERYVARETFPEGARAYCWGSNPLLKQGQRAVVVDDVDFGATRPKEK